MNYGEKAIKILGEGLAKHKAAIQDLQESLSKNKNLQSIEARQLQLDIEKKFLEIDATVENYVKTIRIPKDGQDAVVDYEMLKGFIAKEVMKVSPEKADYNTISSTIAKEVAKIPIPKNGKPGKDANPAIDGISPKIDYTKVNQDIMAQFPKKAIVEDIKKSLSKEEEIIGIKDIKLEKENLIIIMTDGKKYKFPMSFKNFQMFGNGGSGKVDPANFSYDLVDQTVIIPHNQQMIVMGGIEIENKLYIDGKLILEH